MKAAIVGCGRIATQHIEALRARKTEICALCDIKPERAKSIKDSFAKNANVYSVYSDMLQKEKPDCVHILTPHYLHAEMAVAALDTGINVLLEKPVCINQAELEKIRAAVKKSSAQLGVCFQNRFLDNYIMAYDYLKDKFINSVAATVFWSRDREYYESESWRGKLATEGGGVLINQAIHTLDFILKVCKDVKKLTATTALRHLKGVIDVEDFAEVYMEHISGTRTVFIATNALSTSYPVNIKFSCGNEIVEISGDELYINSDKIAFKTSEGKAVIPYWGLGHYKLIDNFYSSLESGQKFSVDIEEGAKSIETLFEIYKSCGKEIIINR